MAAFIGIPAWILLNLMMSVCQIYCKKFQKKTQKECQWIIFYIHLLKYDTNAASTVFLDSMYTIFFLPYVETLSLITIHSEKVIGNIFLNKIEDSLISGNIILTISYHFAQFQLQKRNIKIDKSKLNLFRHNFKNLNKALFDFELRRAVWNTVLEIDKKQIL